MTRCALVSLAMKVLLPCLALAGCSTTTTCPTAGDLETRLHVEAAEASTVASMCRDQHWSAEITACFRDATDEQGAERCLTTLPDTDRRTLKAAFREQHHADLASRFPELVARLRAELDKELTSVIFTRDHACDGLRAVISDGLAQLKHCETAGDELPLYALRQVVLHEVQTLEQASTTAAPASDACRRSEAVVRKQLAEYCP